MKRLLTALIAAGFASATVGALAADEKPYTAKPQIEKPGRAADDSTQAGQDVKSGPVNKPGRAADEGTPKKKGKKRKSTEQPKQ